MDYTKSTKLNCVSFCKIECDDGYVMVIWIHMFFYVGRSPCPQYPGGQCPGALGLLNTLTASSSDPNAPAVPSNPLQHGLEYFLIPQFYIFTNALISSKHKDLFPFSPVGGSNIPVGLLPVSGASSYGGAPDSPAPGSSLSSYSAPSRGSGASGSPSGPGPAGGTINVHLVLTPGGVAPSGPNQG